MHDHSHTSIEMEENLSSRAVVLELLRQELHQTDPDINWLISFFEDLRDRLLLLVPINDPSQSKLTHCFEAPRLRSIMEDRNSARKHFAELVNLVFSVCQSISGASTHRLQLETEKKHFVESIQSGCAFSEIVPPFFEAATNAIDQILMSSPLRQSVC